MWSTTTRVLPCCMKKSKVTFRERCQMKTLRKVVCASFTQCGAYTTDSSVPNVMQAWQIHNYGDVSSLQLTEVAKLPKLMKPTDVLVKIKAASINPIDIKMLGGYGAKTMKPMRAASGSLHNGSEFPLVLGRDFSGVVVKTGKGVASSHFKPGDEVYGAGSAFRQGTHAQYTAVDVREIAKKPKYASHVEAASIPYVAATTWSALCSVGGLHDRNCLNKRILMTGASGGLGTFALQLLNVWGAEVIVTCSAETRDMVHTLGAHTILDYKDVNFKKELKNLSGFDFVFDTMGSFDSDEALKLLNKHTNSKYVTIRTPLLQNNDELGVPFGLAKSFLSLGQDALKAFKDGQRYGWAVFQPNGKALHTIAHHINQGKIKPVVENVYPFRDLKEGYERVAAGHTRGKTVIDMEASVQ